MSENERRNESGHWSEVGDSPGEICGHINVYLIERGGLIFLREKREKWTKK
jgi:hypothetical protein